MFETKRLNSTHVTMMKTESAVCNHRAAVFGLYRSPPPTASGQVEGTASMSRRDDMEAAVAIAELSGGMSQPRVSSGYRDVTVTLRNGVHEESANDTYIPFPTASRISHVKTAVMPARQSHVQKALKRRLEERSRINTYGGGAYQAGSEIIRQPDDRMVGARDVNPLKRAIEMERDNFVTGKRHRPFPAEEPVREESVGTFVKCCMPSAVEELETKFGSFGTNVLGVRASVSKAERSPTESGSASSLESTVNGQVAAVVKQEWNGRRSDVSSLIGSTLPRQSLGAIPTAVPKNFGGADGLRTTWMMSSSEAKVQPGLSRHFHHGGKIRDTIAETGCSDGSLKPVSHLQQTSAGSGMSMSNGRLTSSSLLHSMEPQRHRSHTAKNSVKDVASHNRLYSNISLANPTIPNCKIEKQGESNVGPRGNLSDYYYLGRSAAESHFFPHLPSPANGSNVFMPDLFLQQTSDKILPQMSSRRGVDVGTYCKESVVSSPRLARTALVPVVDGITAKKVKQGDFGSLHTLRDYYRRPSRLQSGDGPVLLRHRHSWPSHRISSPTGIDEDRCWQQEEPGISDTELAIDLSVHKKRPEATDGEFDERSGNVQTWNEHLRPDAEYSRKSKSCGSSPISSNQFMYHRNHYADFDTINQHVQPFMDMPLDEGYGGMAVQDPPSPPSPSSLAIIIQQEEDRHALERTSVLPALTSKHSSYHCVDDDDHHKSMSVASVLPNSRLPLKKRRLHGDIDSGSFGGINNRMEGTITTTAVARHSTTNCTGRNLASNDEEAFHVALTADDDGDLPLHIAVVHEDIAVIRSLIRVMCMFGVSLDQYNKLKQTPLHLAVITGNVDTVRLLLNGGASPNVVDRDGLNSIHHAVQRSSISCLCCLLEESTSTPNVDAVTYNGLTALHLAVMRSDVDAIDVLLHAGAQVDATDGRNGRTALFYAVERNNMEVALVLLENGADARRTMYSNCSPAQAAVTARCSTELLQLLERYNNCTTFKSLLPCCATG